MSGKPRTPEQLAAAKTEKRAKNALWQRASQIIHQEGLISCIDLAGRLDISKLGPDDTLTPEYRRLLDVLAPRQPDPRPDNKTRLKDPLRVAIDRRFPLDNQACKLYFESDAAALERQGLLSPPRKVLITL